MAKKAAKRSQRKESRKEGEEEVVLRPSSAAPRVGGAAYRLRRDRAARTTKFWRLYSFLDSRVHQIFGRAAFIARSEMTTLDDHKRMP